MNRFEFQGLAELRIKEAKVLLDNTCFEGAYYLAGYAVECALKASIAKKTRAFDFPPKVKIVTELYKHDLTILIKMAELEFALKDEIKSVPEFATNWAVVKDWSEQARYETKIEPKPAGDLYTAIANDSNGVLSWLKKHW